MMKTCNRLESCCYFCILSVNFEQRWFLGFKVDKVIWILSSRRSRVESEKSLYQAANKSGLRRKISRHRAVADDITFQSWMSPPLALPLCQTVSRGPFILSAKNERI